MSKKHVTFNASKKKHLDQRFPEDKATKPGSLPVFPISVNSNYNSPRCSSQKLRATLASFLSLIPASQAQSTLFPYPLLSFPTAPTRVRCHRSPTVSSTCVLTALPSPIPTDNSTQEPGVFFKNTNVSLSAQHSPQGFPSPSGL